MANIILPAVPVLDEIDQHTKLLIEQAGEINRYPISDLDIGGGDVTIDLSNADSITDSGNFINADTLGGRPANNYLLKNELILDDNTIVINKADIIESASGEVISINDSASVPIQGLKLFGKTTQNGTPTPDAPVPLVSAGDGGSLEITVAGKNLAKCFTPGTKSDMQLTVNEDGSATFNGTATTGIEFFSTKYYLPVDTYTLSIDNPFPSGSAVVLFGNIRVEPGETKITGVLENTYSQMYIWINEGVTLNNFTIKIQLERSSIATAYEPYKEPQILTVSTPNGLPGIPVATGGNYTDEAGQQWVCDEVDFSRGMYVQRVYKVKITDFSKSTAHYQWPGGFTEGSLVLACGKLKTNIGLCSHFIHKGSGEVTRFAFGEDAENGAVWFVLPGTLTQSEWRTKMTELSPVILGCLESPIETALSAEELAAYAVLYTSYPNTTILNDSGAGMEVKYGADTKLYIDKLVKSILPIYVPQELTEAQKTQARVNIGAATVNDVLAALPTWTGGTY